jgi:hypothetical protein
MKRLLFAVALLTLVSAYAVAELQNVQIGGSLRIRGRYYGNIGNSPRSTFVRIPADFLPARAIGDRRGVVSRHRWNEKGNDNSVVESTVRLWVDADFTDDVAAKIELESFDVWGEDFRSNYITGADSRADTSDDLEVVQAYIEAKDMFGSPVRLRIGRQFLKFGKAFLVGDKTSSSRAQMYDAFRLTYKQDDIEVDAFAAKLFEGGVAEQDGDVDFYGVYGTYKGIDVLSISAYYFWLRDARRINDTNGIWFTEWIEDFIGLDDYDVTNIHTVGIRLFGESGAFDYDLDVAYQFGNADSTGRLFRFNTYGDDGADYGHFGMDGEFGYTMDIAWQPRFYLGGAYYQGEDNRGTNFWDWLNPFNGPEASVSFNRLFSDNSYSEFLDSQRVMSNFWQARVGVETKPFEKVSAGLELAYFEAVEGFDPPVSFKLGDFYVPVAPVFSFWTKNGADDIGFLTKLKIKYQYSEDLAITFSWEHLFAGDGLTDGVYSDRYGTVSMMGSDNDDADYVDLDFRIAF